MSDRPETVLRATGDYKRADEWALVLISEGLSPSLRFGQGRVVLSVPEEEVETALAYLSAYENENPLPSQREQNSSDHSLSLTSGIAVAGALILSHALTIRWKEAAPWIEQGSADASRILCGELWRAVTALTLHADLLHLFSNAVAAAIFVSALSSIVGAGLAVALLVLAGGCGNLANALMQGSSHISVGASTAIFGAVGVLGGHGFMRRRRESARRRGGWIPIAAALGLLAMLGTGMGRTDVLAHLFGFVFGAVLGSYSRTLRSRPAWTPRAMGLRRRHSRDADLLLESCSGLKYQEDIATEPSGRWIGVASFSLSFGLLLTKNAATNVGDLPAVPSLTRYVRFAKSLQFLAIC